jgi:hypothetical protein
VPANAAYPLGRSRQIQQRHQGRSVLLSASATDDVEVVSTEKLGAFMAVRFLTA